jgi:hypothetical protein
VTTLTATLDQPRKNLTITGTARLVRFAVLAVVLAYVYHAFGIMLVQHGIIAPNLAFFGEKAALALHGAPPRLVNIGFVYPPLSFVLQLPFGDPLLAQSVIGGILIAAIVDFLIASTIDPVLRTLALLVVVASPVMLYLAVQDYSTLLLCVLFAASIRYAMRFLRDGYSLHLFVASTLLGLTFFVDFRCIVLLLAIAPALALPLWSKRGPAYSVSIALTVCVPMLFFALAWAYVNWTFLGDPFAFVHGRSSFFRAMTAPPDILMVAGDPLATLARDLSVTWQTLPLTLPYFLGFLWLRRAVPAFTVPATVIYASPVLLLLVALYGGTFRPQISLVAMCLLIVCFGLEAMRPNRWVMGAALALSFVASCGALFLSPESNERAFANLLVGRPVVDALAPYRDVVAQFASAERILIDDTSAYQLVYLADDPRRFILPYQYEYASALSNPRAFADTVVVGRRRDDSIAALYPSAERGLLPGFHETFRDDAFIVFRRDGAP